MPLSSFLKLVQYDISFEIIDDPALSDISFYYDSEINLGATSGITFGVTVSNSTLYPRRQWIEIFLNGPQLDASSPDFVSYVFNHELLHALGLEHTFDDSDGDFYLSTDPVLSASPEETVMSYRPPVSGSYPTDLTESDYNALNQIWGPAKNDISHLTEQPVYRLFNVVSGNHLFTTNLVEIDLLTGSAQNSTCINVGIAYPVSVGANHDLYSFYNSHTDRHFYSSNSYERDLLISNSDSGYIYEGVAYQVFTEISNTSAVLSPVFRFFDPDRDVHLYTATYQEKAIWESNGLNWINEGIAWYA